MVAVMELIELSTKYSPLQFRPENRCIMCARIARAAIQLTSKKSRAQSICRGIMPALGEHTASMDMLSRRKMFTVLLQVPVIDVVNEFAAFAVKPHNDGIKLNTVAADQVDIGDTSVIAKSQNRRYLAKWFAGSTRPARQSSSARPGKY